MKVSLGLPTHRVELLDEFCTGRAIAELSQAAEAAGFDAVFVTDHPIPDETWLAKGGHHTLDPLVALSFVAAATTTLRLQTNLLIAAYRNPLLTAKAVASLDVLSGGRVILGVGAGYLEGEFAALDIDFASRNDATDDALRVMQSVWAGETVRPSNRAEPRPAQRPHPPIWIGGNSRRAIRRAVELADGWAPMPNPAKYADRRRTPALETLDDLAARIDYARSHAEATGRTAPLDIVFMPLGVDMFSRERPDPGAVAASAQALADIGVTYLTSGVPGDTRAEVLDHIAFWGDAILPLLTSL